MDLSDCGCVWIAGKVGVDIHVPLWMNFKNSGDALTFHLAPSSGQTFKLSNTLVYK